MASLRERALTGIIWNLAEQLAVRGISVFVTLVLAYFLSPEDFGLMAMMAMFISIATSVMDSGFKQALIRLPNVKQLDFNTAFYANIILGCVAYLLLFFAAGLIAEFYDEERLIALIRITGLVVILNAFQVVQYANLSRELNFKVQFRAALPASVISAVVAIAMAYQGYGVWALVVQMLISGFLVAVLLWWQRLWRPTLNWSANSLNSMFHFGYKLFLSSLLEIGFKNMYVVVIAKLFSTTLAGLYFFADRVRELVIYQLVSSIQKVTFPALSSIQAEPSRLKENYRKVIAVTSFILFPTILFVAALAEPIFRLFLPERWGDSAVYLQLMCIGGVLVPIHAVNLNILKVLGRSDLFLLLQVIKKAVAVTILLLSFRYGIVGILIGQIISSIIAYVPNSFYSKRLISYSVKEQLSDFLPGLVLAGLISASLWGVESRLVWHELTVISSLACVGVIVYLLGAYLFKFSALLLTKELIIKKMKGKVT